MNILVLNGPNLNLLGTRQPEIYGTTTYAQLEETIHAHAKALDIRVTVRQSNHEGVLVDWIQQAKGVYDGIVINPAAYTHTSIALLDALEAVELPAVEVHISDVSKREAFRQTSFVRQACLKTIMGHGIDGYTEAMTFLAEHLQ